MVTDTSNHSTWSAQGHKAAIIAMVNLQKRSKGLSGNSTSAKIYQRNIRPGMRVDHSCVIRDQMLPTVDEFEHLCQIPLDCLILLISRAAFIYASYCQAQEQLDAQGIKINSHCL